MNKNKIIFAILGAIVLAFVVYLAMNLANSNKQVARAPSGNLTLWLLHDKKDAFQSIIQAFKEKKPAYSSKTITVQSFTDQATYQNALAAALLKWEGPDIFSLNNSENSFLENAVSVVSPSKLSPNDFRLNYKPIFSKDLIISDTDDSSTQYVKGVPLGYETLGVIYNRKYFPRASQLADWSSFVQAIQKLSEKQNSVIPLALWNSLGVSRYSEVISSLLSLEGSDALWKAGSTEAKQVLSFYNSFEDINGDNGYGRISAPYATKSDIDFFAEGDVAAMIGFPRDIARIDEKGYQANFLYAASFPGYTGTDAKQTIFYNYLVQNTKSTSTALAEDFLVFLAWKEGQQAVLAAYPYYLPAHSSVEADKMEKKIYSDYNIVYKNFILENAEQISFDTGNDILYKQWLREILSESSGMAKSFEKMRSYITCSVTKYKDGLNLSSSCVR